MQLNTKLGELTIQELKTRQLAQDYLKIQQNTEYLTHLVRYAKHKTKVPLRTDSLPDIKSLAFLTVQLSYLLFTCSIKYCNIFISKKMLMVNAGRREPSQEMYYQYIIERQMVKLSLEEQRYINQNFTKHEFNANQVRAYGQSIANYINQIIAIIKANTDRIKLATDKVILQKFKHFEHILQNYIEPQIHALQHPRIVILALQESEIFRQFSLLVKVMNNSIFSAIRNNKNKNIFDQICKLEHVLSIKCSKQKLQNQVLQIESTIEELMKYLVKNEVVSVQQSIQKNARQDPNKQFMIGQLEVSPNDRKYTIKMHILEKAFGEFSQKLFQKLVFQALNNYINHDILENETQGGKIGSRNQFIIEYISSKGIITIKYVTPIELNIENTDIITFQCNSISYFLSNVSMEIIEKVSNKTSNKKQKYLAIKTLAYLNTSERPLFKLLLMIDLVMLCAKITEPQFCKKVIRNEDYKRIQQITSTVEHMIKLFIRKIQKFYKLISEAQNKHKNSW